MRNLLIAFTLLLTSCGPVKNDQPSLTPSSPKLSGEIPNHKDILKIEQLSNQFDQGLYTITINDTTKVLFYRGVESCTMIQIK